MPQEAITAPYVDYKYYQESFLGTTVPESSFPSCEKRAEAFLHRITFDRVKRLPEIPREVKDAICAMAECTFTEGKKTPGIRSENSDGYSVSYSDSTADTRNADLYRAAEDYLSNTGLLYRGRSEKYDCQC